MTIILTVSKKFIPVGTSFNHYFVPVSKLGYGDGSLLKINTENDIVDKVRAINFNENKWESKKFKDV